MHILVSYYKMNMLVVIMQVKKQSFVSHCKSLPCALGQLVTAPLLPPKLTTLLTFLIITYLTFLMISSPKCASLGLCFSIAHLKKIFLPFKSFLICSFLLQPFLSFISVMLKNLGCLIWRVCSRSGFCYFIPQCN